MTRATKKMAMIAFHKLQIFVQLSSVLAFTTVSTVSEPIGKWAVIQTPMSMSLEAITVSANYLWGIDDRTGVGLTAADNNVIYCECPCSNASSWIDATGQLEQTIDANEDEVWGVNDRGQIYKRPIDGSGGWIQITGGNDDDCSGKCFADTSVSNSGYIWAISRENETYMLCQGGVRTRCGNSDSMLIDNELSLVHIEAGDEEVWAVNATNHIFKRPVNGSGAWSIVPGEMRYISASGNAHIWGIAPNNSLYMCARPCTGCWLYVGGSFQQVEGGNNSVVGVTTDNILIAMRLLGIGKKFSIISFVVISIHYHHLQRLAKLASYVSTSVKLMTNHKQQLMS